MGLSFLGLSAVGWHDMTDNWWDQLIAAFLLATFVLGSGYIIYNVIRYYMKRPSGGRMTALSRPVSRYLQRMRKDYPTKLSSLAKSVEEEELKTFGVFLGGFTSPPTLAQQKILSKWQVLVVDPSQPGVVDALSSHPSSSKHILARVDVSAVVASDASISSETIIRNLETVIQALRSAATGPFTGILLANFRKHFHPAVVSELGRFVSTLNSEIWLELSYPEYISEEEATMTDMNFVRGVVYRNGTMRPDGDRQNFFQMNEMRTCMRAVAAQRAAHGLLLVMWETVDDDAEIQYAVANRTYNWCVFNSALCWVGHNDSMFNADIAEARSLKAKPLGALMWLKNEENMKAHDTWRVNDTIANTSQNHEELYETLRDFIPDISARLQLSAPNKLRPISSESAVSRRNAPASVVDLKTAHLAVFKDEAGTGLGCFQLGHEANFADFDELRRGQAKLKELDLLHKVEGKELEAALAEIEGLRGSERLSPTASQAVTALLDLLSASIAEPENPRIQVFSGLHSGFQTDAGTQHWGLYDVELESDRVVLYLSNKAKDRAATILHTFLSSRQCSRIECLMAEQQMAERNGKLSPTWKLPARIISDLEQLSPAETVQLLMRMQSDKAKSKFFASMCDCMEYQLLDTPMLSQQRALNSVAYLNGDVSIEDMVTSRVNWLAEKGCHVPDTAEAIRLFQDVDAQLYTVCIEVQSNVYARLSNVVQRLFHSEAIDAGADILALAIFSAFRKLALDEVYLEVMDRNVYPNHAADQAACFAENFALGSRCDSFFDMTPRAIGKIIAERYRAYYSKYQPPRRDDVFTELPTAYAAMQADIDPEGGEEKISFTYRVTFFGIFAVPALIDVMLLTTIGRGLYLTTFMTSEEKTMATRALMFALLLSGAFGQWICSGGSYYFYANGFPAMNLFILTRFAAGVAVCILGAIIGFIIVISSQTTTAACIFLFYFIMLSMYMLALNALSIYQMPGSEFLSGRTTIITCIPILFISPIVSMAVENDITVYLPVLGSFLLILLWRAREVISQWSSWYLKIPFVKDSEVIAWYREHLGSEAHKLDGLGDNQVMPMARTAIHGVVLKEVHRWFFTKATKDPLIKKLADGYNSTMFLMRWYCRHKRSWMPLPYSTTWNLTLKAGMENMTNMQKGLRLHSAFLHWRSTGKDIWSGLLYFVVALLDKWAALLTGGNLVGLSAASSEVFRLGVGFGLCYYLFGAVALDTVSQPLWTAANEKINKPITSIESLKQANLDDTLARRRLYWRSLCKFFFLHLWGASLFACLMWVFQSSKDDTIMFMAYIGAYSGLLWYQYNKIFCGMDGAKPLAFAAVVGLPIGIALHVELPMWSYSGVASLAVATWLACIYSLWISKIGMPTFIDWKTKYRSLKTDDTSSLVITYSASSLEPQLDLSQTTLKQLFESFCSLDPEDRYTLDPAKHPGKRILELLSLQERSRTPPILKASFQSAQKYLSCVAQSWQAGDVVIELVSSRHTSAGDPKVRSISRKAGDLIHIIVILGPDRVNDEWTLNVQRHWRVIAEAVVNSFSELQLGMTRGEAALTELLVTDHSSSHELSIPEGIKRQLEVCPLERARVLAAGEDVLLRYVLLGIDCEREWETLPESVRSYLLKRSCGGVGVFTNEVENWIATKINSQDPRDIDSHIARCDLGAALTKQVLAYAKAVESRGFDREESEYITPSDAKKMFGPVVPQKTSIFAYPKKIVSTFFRGLNLCIKFLIISLTADIEYQRELDFVLRDAHPVVRWPIMFFLNTIWSYCRVLQTIIIPPVLFHRHEHVSKLEQLMRGMTTVLEKNRVVTETFSGPATWFWSTQADGNLRVAQYAGKHVSEPTDSSKLKAVNTYNSKLVLQEREIYKKGQVANVYRYDYDTPTSKLPLQRECVRGDLDGEIVQYDHRGYIASGSAMRGENRVNWKFWYRKNAKHEDELLWAEYTFPHITIKVLWSMPPRNPQKKLDQWIPFSVVTEATFIQGEDTYHASWDFEHKFHPEVSVTLNGKPIDTPKMIEEDWFHVLKKPENCSFLSENPLISFSSIKTNPVSRLLGLNVKRYPIPTAVARTQLWKAWKDGREVDAISARWLDEKLLRADRIMRPYWRRRDFGRLEAAKTYIDEQADTIMARVDVDPQISSWVHIAFKMSDLYAFGQGGESRINTRHLSSQLMDTEYDLHVLCMDTSTWPNDPGGVSACRRDMVNDLKTIKWHVLAESAHDYGVPRFQIERNVQSLTILPLWGLDFLNPIHGVLESSLDTAVVQRSFDTHRDDIVKNFLPILSSLVKCSRVINLTREHVEEATAALCNLNTYFETSRNWNDVWQHPVVKEKWRELWLSEDVSDALNISSWWEFEMPTIKQLDDALNLWCRYLFIISLPVPEHIPDVFQASHHFTGATYGIVCKQKRQVSLHIWDHCISYREFTTFMSSAVSFDAPFVNSSLIQLTHLSCVLLEHHADVVLPCCDYFNPGWEEELGTAEGAIEHRNTFKRKIDPVVNGICNMEKFEPTKEIKTDQPTVVMLSHVQYAKDIKNAIMATDLIVNKWGFRDYRLHIYGDQERAATIATECQELIAAKNLTEHVILKGLGNPSVVLQDAWLFLNSSISEGLPLAMGEAALTGVPVVCTDVGASYCVVTDRASGNRFSEVVPPNDSESLARAQVNILALLGRWAEHAGDGPNDEVPVLEYPVPSPESVKKVSERMYAKRESRRALGMLGRQNVFNNFSSDRYLREHEQMLWIGKLRSPAHRARTNPGGAATPSIRSADLWFTKEAKSPYASWSRPVSRITPESWISLTSEDTRRGGWLSASSSTYNLSMKELFTKEKPGKSNLSVVELGDTL